MRDPLIMHWPAGLKTTGGARTQFCHAIDPAPTILDALGISQPDVVAGVSQTPMHGISLTPVFENPAAALDRGPQYFEMLGHRGIWKDGWKAVTHHESGKPFDEDRWELYHLADDFSEYDDLAEREPAKLKEMIDLWWAEAEKHGVLPLDDRGPFALFAASRRPGLPSSTGPVRLSSAGLAHCRRRLSAGRAGAGARPSPSPTPGSAATAPWWRGAA